MTINKEISQVVSRSVKLLGFQYRRMFKESGTDKNHVSQVVKGWLYKPDVKSPDRHPSLCPYRPAQWGGLVLKRQIRILMYQVIEKIQS